MIARLCSITFDSAVMAAAPVASMSAGARTALLALLGLLVVIFGCLIAFAFVLRRRPGMDPRAPAGSGRGGDGEAAGSAGQAVGQGVGQLPDQAADSGRPRRGAPKGDPKACPACRREFDNRLRFCPYDATRLVPAPQMLERLADPSRPTYVCPECQRAFEGRLRFCPLDGADLVLASREHEHEHEPGHEPWHEPGDGLEHDERAHDSAKICPECRGRYGFAASFCGKDGVPLVVLN